MAPAFSRGNCARSAVKKRLLEFTAIAIGTSPINILDDSITTGWNASSDASIVQGVVYNQGTITVGPTSIPIPTLAIWLLAFSLGAVVHLRLRGRAGDDSLNGV
jgi:hypothetical protein